MTTRLTTLEVFDPPMCCTTGVCGVQIDPVLAQCAADLKWLAGQGVEVRRHNLGQDPQAFAANPLVVRELESGTERLPLTLIDGQVVATGAYLSRTELASRLGLPQTGESAGAPAAGARPTLQVTIACTPGSGCCE